MAAEGFLFRAVVELPGVNLTGSAFCRNATAIRPQLRPPVVFRALACRILGSHPTDL